MDESSKRPKPAKQPLEFLSDGVQGAFLSQGAKGAIRLDASNSMDDVKLPADRRPPPPDEDDGEDLDLLADFALSVNTAAKRHDIRRIMQAHDAEPPEPLARKVRPLERYAPQVAAFLSRNQEAERLSAFAKSVAARSEKSTVSRLLTETTKQVIIDSLNPLLAISANVAEAGGRVKAMRDWNEMSYETRLGHVAGLTGNVAEVLSAVTPPPGNIALKLMGVGMALVKVGAESAAAEVEAARAPKRKPGPDQARRPAGTGMLPNTQSRANAKTGQLNPALGKPRAKTGQLSADPAKTGFLPAPPPAAAKEPPPKTLKERLERLAAALKDQWI